jgi:hypothetical protein
MNLTWIYDFLHVLQIKMGYSTKYYYFSMPIQITRIYLLDKHKLNHNNYSE